MKKTFRILSLMAAAAFILTGCDEPKKTVVDDNVSLTLSIDKNTLKVDEEATLTVKASANVKSDLTVNIAVEGSAVSAPATVVIEKDKNEITATVKGLAEGNSKITITADNVEYGVQSVDITVKKGNDPVPDPDPLPDGMEIGNLYANGPITPPSVPFNGLVCESETYGKVYPGSLYYHECDWIGYPGTGIYKSSIDTYGGAMVGKMVDGEGFFTTYDEGTVIDDKMPWLDYETRGRGRFPIIVKENDTENSIPDGTHFIVLSLPVKGDPNNYDWIDVVNMPCWLKIKVEGMSVTVLDGAMLIAEGDGEFKVGMK